MAVRTDPADLGVAEAVSALGAGELSSLELVEACLRRIDRRDGTHSHDGDPASINAWVRVYEEDAIAAAKRADEIPAGERPPLHGIPVGLKDVYGVAGKPLTASSRAFEDVPDRDSDVWASLKAAGMILLGHLHTHEFTVGGTTDQVGNPWALDRTTGGSSGGSAAALAARMTPAATGTDTAGSLRIPSALCGTSTIKPTYGTTSFRGAVPLAPSFDHAGPMARTVGDCAALLAPITRLSGEPLEDGLRGKRLVLSPRLSMVDLDADVAAGFDSALAACRTLGAELVEAPAPAVELDVGVPYLNILFAELAAWHRRLADRRDLYRPALREWVEEGERQGTSAIDYWTAQIRRREDTYAWLDWFAEHRVDAVIEPTVPVVAWARGDGYDHWGTDAELISLTSYWNWTGLPAAALPAGVGARSGLPVGVSLVGAPGSDWDLLGRGIALQAELGVPAAPVPAPAAAAS
ncbi:MAG TPA: amidase [Solirubrobacterales bacterium]|nr:amidase [Solirubrobacterales bacterium]